MDGNDAKALRSRPGPQWDVSQTAFNSAGALRDIIRAVSYDDVQPQAILAAEALGLGLLVSPTRINEAIVALDGEESVKWDRFKIVIGLQSKGTVKAIRNSTALTQFFLVATACKLCYTDVELGDVFFDIIAESGVLALFPAASGQLARLIGTFSGHCDRILPVNLMHELAVAVDACSGNRAFYHRMENSELAKLICRVFDYLRDDSVEHVSLTGCLSGMWLATAFLWLLPEKTAILVDNQTVKGSNLARLTINLTKDATEPKSVHKRAWKVQTWRSDASPTTFVLEHEERMQPRHHLELPMKQAKSFFHHKYDLPFSDRDRTGRRDAINTIGELAQALITYVTENGTVYIDKHCCGGKKCSKAPLIRLQKEDWIASYSDAIVCYGWDAESSALVGETSALEAIKAVFSGKKTVIPLSVMEFKEGLKDWVTERSMRWSNNPSSPTSYRIVENAMDVAAHAVASSLCNVQAGNLKLRFPAGSSSSDTSLSWLFELISERGMDLGHFRLLVMSSVFPYASFNKQDLAVSQDGLVAGWAVLWEQTTLQRRALQLNVLRGTIEREGFRYERITEPYLTGSGSEFICHTKVPLSLFRGDTYIRLSMEPEKMHISTKYIWSAVGNSLELITLLQCRDEVGREDRRSVSWISALSYFAVATHIDRTSAMSRIQEEAIARILHNRPLEAYWVSACHNYVGGMTRENNIVLRTQGNEELRFWAAAVLAQKNGITGQCFSLVVRHSGPLISSLHEASKKDGVWAVIC